MCVSLQFSCSKSRFLPRLLLATMSTYPCGAEKVQYTSRTALRIRLASLAASACHGWYVPFELYFSQDFFLLVPLLFRRIGSSANPPWKPRSNAWRGSTRHVFFSLTQYSVVPVLTASGQEHDPNTIRTRAPEAGMLPATRLFQPVLAHPPGLIFVLFLLPWPSDQSQYIYPPWNWARSKTSHVLVSLGEVISSMRVSKTLSCVRMRKDVFNILVA